VHLDQIIKSINLNDLIELFGGLKLNGPLSGATAITGTVVAGAVFTPTYGPNIAINAALGNLGIITITDGVAFAINAPTNPTTGQVLRLNFVNASGGAAGAGTFNAIFKMVSNTLAVIANGKNRTVTFFFNGTNWVESSYSADVAN
jgi:hypothetical protein